MAHVVPHRANFPDRSWRALAAMAATALLAACARTAVPDRTPPLPDDAPRAAADEAALRDPQAGPALTDAELIDHVLARVTFGARPADRELVARIGPTAFLEEQLHPERIDDAAVAGRLAAYRAVTASPAELLRDLAARQKREASAESFLQAMVQAEESRARARTDGPGGAFVGELAQAKMVRAVASERQLEEVMVDFWFNHFNVFGGKDRIRTLVGSYERDAIRPHALGRFRDLLGATAQHPAMLVYLDNWRSSASTSPARQRRTEFRWLAKAKRPGRGLNENYARELLELHTLGVDGGYTQEDVTEVARCFTGWTVAELRSDPRYLFRRGMHDDGEKRVLGTVIEAGGGESDGQAVLDLLARHPSTARFVANKLVRRFVSDDPPQLLVERVAETFESTGGDIRSMLRTIFSSPELFSRRALRAKVRSPLELVAGSVRALGGDVDDALSLARAVERIGEPLYQAQPPTGYGDTAGAWVSSGALLARINFALALAEGRMDGVRVDLSSLVEGEAGPDQVLSRAQALLGAGELSDRTREFVLARLREVPAKRVEKKPDVLAERAVGLLLGAPELQRR
jgi:uncharacterized protein (DUF1800 family)